MAIITYQLFHAMFDCDDECVQPPSNSLAAQLAALESSSSSSEAAVMVDDVAPLDAAVPDDAPLDVQVPLVDIVDDECIASLDVIVEAAVDDTLIDAIEPRVEAAVDDTLLDVIATLVDIEDIVDYEVIGSIDAPLVEAAFDDAPLHVVAPLVAIVDDEGKEPLVVFAPLVVAPTQAAFDAAHDVPRASSSSSSSSVEERIVTSSSSSSPSPVFPESVAAWLRVTLPGLRERVEDTLDEPVIRWRLQSPGEVGDARPRIFELINLYMSKYRRFKIGHTWVPLRRLVRFRYCKHSCDRLVFVYVSDDADHSSALEVALVEAFRGDRRLLNVRPGGELTHIGQSPFFVYVSFSYK